MEDRKATEIRSFYADFTDTETELIFFTQESCKGAAILCEGLIRPSVEFTASVDVSTGELSTKRGRLEWLKESTSGEPDFGHDFRKYGICHIRCRRNKPVVLTENTRETMNNRYCVLEVIDDGLSDPRLEKLRAKCLKPVYIDDETFGRFELNREYSHFEGKADLHGRDISVFLETDRADGKTAGKTLAYFREIYSDPEILDKKLYEYAAAKLLDTVCDWADRDITEKQFRGLFYISSLHIGRRKTVTAYLDGDADLLGDHSIEVCFSGKGEFISARLA